MNDIWCPSEAGEGGARAAGGGAAGGGASGGCVGRAWYYGAITRTHCDALLNQHGHDGDFLIRDSETNVSAPRHRTLARKTLARMTLL